MRPRLVLTVGPDGGGRCLYSELIDLRTLGVIDCRRASRIEFDAEKQQWQVLAPDSDRVLFRHASRAACLDWEQTHLGDG